MSVSQFIGNGIGLLYATDSSNNILFTEPNTPEGVRSMRINGAASAPIAAERSAVGEITCTAAVASNITAVTIAGVNQLSGNVAAIAGNTASTAIAIAANINAFTPASGDNFTANVVGSTIYVFSSPSGGSAANGEAITVSVSSGSTTFTTVDFSGGSSQTGDYDTSVGVKFYLNERGNAPRNSIASATEVTKYIVVRGLQSGIVSKSLAVSTGKVTGINRSCAITNLFVDTQASAATDELDFIETVDFVVGDTIRLSQFIAGRVVIVTDASVSLTAGNIYLTDATPFNCENNKSIELRLQFDATLGLIWVENSRSISGGAVQLSRVEMRQLIANGTVVQGQSYFITDVGQAGIIVSGIDSNSITSLGDYVGYFPDYQDVSGDFAKVWYVFDASVTTGKLYAYKGLMYESLTGVTGTDPSSDPTNWLPVAITDSRYQKEILTVQYDVDANIVTQASDKRGNIVTGLTGILIFKWGCDTCVGNTITNSTTEIYDIEGVFSANTLVSSDILFPSGLSAFGNNTFNNTRISLSVSSSAQSVAINSCFGTGTYSSTLEITPTATGVVEQSSFTGGGYQLLNIVTVGSCVFSTSSSSGSVTVNCAGFDLAYSQISSPVTLTQDTDGLTVNASSSNYSVAKNISAQAATVFSYASSEESASTIVLTSATTKTISSIQIFSGSFPDFPVTFKAATGTTVIIQPIAVGLAASGDIINSALTAITLIGRTNGSDFCTIQKNGNLYSVINSKVHA